MSAFSVRPDNPCFAAKAAAVKLVGLDFDGVMTDNSVYVFEDGREAVRCSRLEGYGLRRLIGAGAEPIIISTEANAVVTARARKLNIACIQDVPDKVAALSELLVERGLDWSEAAFLGNDVNDMEVLGRVGLPGIVADAHECMQDQGFFETRRKGGDGAVREFCDAIAEVIEATRLA
jgi:3-deoxy-D-manno-octulosonate 8-phosphate phosphatase (KDO 8-P phosphatase)